MITDELFDRCVQLLAESPVVARRLMHETLAIACDEATRGEGIGFGSLFARVDYLCKRAGISRADRVAIQQMRRRSNSQPAADAAVADSRDDLLYDVRALAVFISSVFSVPIPSHLAQLIPMVRRPYRQQAEAVRREVRCVVDGWDAQYIRVSTTDGTLLIDYTATEGGVDHTYLPSLLHEGMQLNLLDSVVSTATDGELVVRPKLIIVEPDFLLDISSLAALFTDEGHHPLLYTVNRLQPRANSQAILLGNFAGRALDDLINHDEFSFAQTLTNSFREQAVQFCTCPDFSPQAFKADAAQQVEHLREVVSQLFADRYDRDKAVLEPSFVCERLGLQGRVDLMTTDMRLLVEQKSGKLWGQPLRYKEQHYVQLLLYYGVLRYNFGVSDSRIDMHLLYSRYPAQQGLMVVNFYQTLFREAMALRNRVVAQEYAIARDGFGSVVPLLNSTTIYPSVPRTTFFCRYIEPRLAAITNRLTSLSALERAYFEQMMTFIYREQLYQKTGNAQGQGNPVANLWNMPLSEKQLTGNIFVALDIVGREQSSDYSGYDTLTLRVPDQGEDFMPNFRVGDMVYLYAYDAEPDVRRALLFKGRLQQLAGDTLVVRLSDGQQNAAIFDVPDGWHYALEHGGSDITTNSCIRGLYAFVSASQHKRDLLLGQCVPQVDETVRLSRSYHPHYDDILLRQRQAQDYFLLVGPPGTGKTSMALRFMVEEELASSGAAPWQPAGAEASVLLLSYTNRAVDEMCAMLVEAGISFLRLGHETSCDPRFRPYLLGEALTAMPRLDAMRQRMAAARVIVSTTATLQSQPFIFQLKRFTLAVVDEASQILEPSIVGLLASDAVGRFVLIGDYKQLPAVVQQDEQPLTDPLLTAIGLQSCSRSLFERLIRWERLQGRESTMGVLRRQGRMHPDIAQFPNAMFYARERLEPVPLEHQQDTSLHYERPSVDALDDLLKSRRVMFFDVSGTERTEAALAAELVHRVYRFYGADRFDVDRTVGVIVPYRNQIALIRRELERYGVPGLLSISIDTVERYQGSQRDVIIYSFTAEHEYQLSFLTANCFVEDGQVIDRKLNVAITRARKQMLMVGHADLLRRNAVFGRLIDEYLVF